MNEQFSFALVEKREKWDKLCCWNQDICENQELIKRNRQNFSFDEEESASFVKYFTTPALTQGTADQQQPNVKAWPLPPKVDASPILMQSSPSSPRMVTDTSSKMNISHKINVIFWNCYSFNNLIECIYTFDISDVICLSKTWISPNRFLLNKFDGYFIFNVFGEKT